ncbi:hypothetical protein JCM33774_04290 [Actinophytocola sp. KF-1]
MQASTPAPQGTPAGGGGGGGVSFTIVSFAAATFGSGGIATSGTVVGAVDVVVVDVGRWVGAGAAFVGVLAHADRRPMAAIAKPARSLVRMW